jgi:hypothetical protein
MTAPDSGVDRIFRQATEHLHADVDRLVAGGVDRGRARRRRHLAGTAVAAVATIGVIGAGAAVVPQQGPETARDVPVATGEGKATPSPSPTPTPPPSATPTRPTSHLSEPGEPTVSAADIPQRVDELVPGHDVGEPLMQSPYGVVDTGSEKIVHFLVDGMLTTVIINRASASLAYDCVDGSTVECRTLADGTVVQVAAPTTGDQVTMQGVIAIRETWMVDVMSYNAVDGKDVAPVQPEPALSEEELVALATSDTWFE